MSGHPWDTARSLPPGHYIAVNGSNGRSALATAGDPIAPAARRALAGTATAADIGAIARWLDDVLLPQGQLTLFAMAA